MRWQLPRWANAALIVLVIFVAFGVYFWTRLPPTAAQLPLPGPARTTYANTHYGYKLVYPSDWHLSAENDALIRVFLSVQQGNPEAIAFDIKGFTNSQHLSAAAWWQQHQPSDGSASSIGTQPFGKGLTAYVAQGQGQAPYTVYILTHNAVLCQIIAYQTDPQNSKVINDTINTFAWR